ncbi:MAG: polysulfide reductase NrfD [Verrucomicrobia bacterium]|nr:polysulfide reductase NrfD [Verrucomicrobiota bacterium]
MTLAPPKENGHPSKTRSRLEQHVIGQLSESLAPAGFYGRLWIAFLLFVMLAGLSAYVWQCVNGLKVTAMREYISWGVYMTNFVFFIGVSHAGTLISAILRVTNAEWRRSITRMAEAITVFALMVGAPMVIIDMGRPDRILNVILHGRMNSPILWDVCSICTYICGSLLYLYVAMIPDLAMLSPPAPVWERLTWRQRLYRMLSLGYRGTPEQRRLLERALATMAVIIIPVAVSVHTVVSWIFGMTLRPGWHSTIFGPYFVIGAIFSGTAAIITAMAIFRRAYHLENFLTDRQFQNLGRLMLALNLLYIYFTLSEYLTTWYGSETAEQRLIDLLMGRGAYGIAFWSWAVFCLFLPAVLVMWPKKNTLITRLVVASLLINIGMWIKRYLIIVPTLMTPYIPPEAAGSAPQYFPTWVEWTVTAGGLATFLLLFTLFAKLFPIISVWETVEGVEEIGAKNIGVELELPQEPSKLRRFRPSPVFLAFALLFALDNDNLAGDETKPQPRPEITLETGVEDEEKVLIATIRFEGRPLEGIELDFSVERLFGQMSIGTATTEEDGKASVSFPEDLPAASSGELRIGVEIIAPPEYANLRSLKTFQGGVKTHPQTDAFPRALWSPKAPVGMVLTIFTLLSIVWSTYAFVIRQLIQIRRGAKS